MLDRAFEGLKLRNGLLLDLEESGTRVYGVMCGGQLLHSEENATAFVFCIHGGLWVEPWEGDRYRLRPGMYASVPGKVAVYPVRDPDGLPEGIVISQHGWRGMFAVGGPVEAQGRLRYIDGCMDTLLVPPVKLGDPCLNGLWFPGGTEQTMHTHPSVRIGVVLRGRGQCVTPGGRQPLLPGMVFVIHADGQHRFRTERDESMVVVAWHPDSDCGPTDEQHPMLTRTIIEGVSAAAPERAEHRTR
jgi:quercetin dioxygenase-like cupin family protein